MKNLIALIGGAFIVLSTPIASAESAGRSGPPPAAGSMEASAAQQSPADNLDDRRVQYLALVRKAKPASLPLSLIDAVITQESGYRPHVRGRDGEVGLMQILPSTARGVARQTGLREVADLPDVDLVNYLKKPANNLRLGLAYLSWCHDRAKGEVGATIGCYNAGPGNMWRWKSIAITRRYVRNVEDHISRYPGS